LIAVSGATGFLGAHMVCTLLQNNKQVKAIKRLNSNLNEFNLIFNYRFNAAEKEKMMQHLTWVDADILDVPAIYRAISDVNEVYHCAAFVSFFQKDAQKMMEINVKGTANIVNASLYYGVKKFCIVSSVAALGRRKSGEHINENTHWENSILNSNYALSKYKAELEVWRAKEEGLNVCVVNPTVILGIGNFNKGSANIIKMVSKGIPFYTNGVNGYVDVEDVAQVMFTLMEKNIFGERFIAVSECLANKDLFYLIATALNIKPPYIEITKIRAEIAWRLIAFLRLFMNIKIGLTKETARSSVNKSYYSNAKIKHAINYNFKPVSKTVAECCKFLTTL